MVPLNPEDLVSNLVKLLHFAFSQQRAEFLNVLSLLKGTRNSEFFLLLLCLVAVVVPYGDVSHRPLAFSAGMRLLPRLIPLRCIRTQVV